MGSKYIRLRNVLLNAIKEDLKNNDYDNFDLSNYKNLRLVVLKVLNIG